MGKTLKEIFYRFSDDQVAFRYGVALKLSCMSLIFVGLVMFFLYILLKIDLIFFNANQFPGAKEFQEAYFDFVFSNSIDLLPYILISLIIIFFSGLYLTYLILRPFKLLSKYCDDVCSGRKGSFNPEMLTDHRLLIMFSDYFFSVSEQMITENKFKATAIPERFTKVHKPVYDWSFFMSYFLIILALTVLSIIGVITVDTGIREQIIELSTNFLKATPSVKYFLSEQFVVFDLIVYLLISFHVAIHFSFGFYLYSKVATPAFAIFSTMRSFLKGNKSARVHLIGYSYLRDDCRKINKYLDLLSKLPE